MGRLHTFVVTLRRESRDLNWGLRLVGGADLSTPLVVTRTNPGTPAGKELIRGDIIAKIDDYDARDLRHEDAQNLFRNAGNTIKLVIQRDADIDGLRSPSRQQYAPSVSPYSQPPTSPYLQPYSSASSYRTPSPAHSVTWKTPLETLPNSKPGSSLGFSHESDRRSIMLSPTPSRATDDTIDESILIQPYRTTPLVLPGAKVRREPGPTESYLRHHPNPAMRAGPHQDYRDTYMKQKLAHKQYNSPINLYSDANIANTIKQNSGPVPHKPTVLYDPAKSETYRAIQEESYGSGEVREHIIPVETKVYSPSFNGNHKRPTPISPMDRFNHDNNNSSQMMSKQHSFAETIQQSNSFKRLMYNVLGDRDF